MPNSPTSVPPAAEEFSHHRGTLRAGSAAAGSTVRATAAIAQPQNVIRVIGPALLAALVCTGLIVEAVITAWNSREQGDVMLIFCPMLGGIFIAIPAFRAWAHVLAVLHDRRAKTNAAASAGAGGEPAASMPAIVHIAAGEESHNQHISQ